MSSSSPMAKVGSRAAPGLRGITGELDAIDGEHFPADQALPVAEVKHLGEELGDFLVETGNKSGQRRKVRRAIATEGDEGDVFATQPLDAPAAHHALGVGAKNDLEQHPRWIGTGAALVILVTTVEQGKIKFVIEQVMHGVFETARQELLLQIHRQEPRAGVDRFVAGHGASPISTSGWSLVIPYGSRHDGGMNAIFLHRR